MRRVFDPDESEALRATARDAALEDPTLAYVLLDLADSGVDPNDRPTRDDIKAECGIETAPATGGEQRVA
ncbi:hypothetical protein [Kitasatospora sp. NPDC097691]|uniref:hypothetical protein n=1 Tax=Kitasatospora sp. NPDC097691 TaxID=3157231 RepID=UPI0033264A20